ncbi:MAG: fused response regulator/phosphatase [Magnetospirillum sp.]|nr:fused response regulator/phosphatase [Magnetospirillum sp.]
MHRDGFSLLAQFATLERSPEQTTSLADARVLIVDDSITNRNLLGAVVRSIGIAQVAEAANGREGLEAVAAFRPDLVLLDVMMPEMDGYEMCRRLRREHHHTHLPVIFVTALTTGQERAACFAAGGSDMVSKPINLAEITARVRVHLHNRMLVADLSAFRERIRHELVGARTAQNLLLPTPAQLAEVGRPLDLDVEGTMETSSEMGGDFWTVFAMGPGRLGVLIADFAGHGVAAAINVFRLHALISRQPPRGEDPAAWLADLNRDLVDLLPPGQFATALFAIVDVGAGICRYARAASPPPLLIVGDQARYLEESAPPIGAFREAEFSSATVAFPPGSTLLLFSDALVESLDPSGAAIDEEAVRDWAVTATRAGKTSLVETVLENFHRHLPGPPPDDLTVVAVHRRR